MDRAPSGWVCCRCGFESSPFKSSARRLSVKIYVPASRIDRKNAKVNAINNSNGEVTRHRAPGMEAESTSGGSKEQLFSLLSIVRTCVFSMRENEKRHNSHARGFLLADVVEQGTSLRARLFKAPSAGAGFGLHQA